MATIHESLGPSPAAKTLMMSSFYFSCFECSSVAHLLSGICRGKSRFGIAWCLICFMYIMLILWLHTFSIIIEYVSIYPHIRNLFGQLTQMLGWLISLYVNYQFWELWSFAILNIHRFNYLYLLSFSVVEWMDTFGLVREMLWAMLSLPLSVDYKTLIITKYCKCPSYYSSLKSLSFVTFLMSHFYLAAM